MGDSGDLDDWRCDLDADVARIFGKRAVSFEPVRRNPTFDNQFGIRRHHDAVRQAWHKPQSLTGNSSGRCPMTFRMSKLDLAADHHRRVMADPHCYRAGLPLSPIFLDVSRIVGSWIG